MATPARPPSSSDGRAIIRANRLPSLGFHKRFQTSLCSRQGSIRWPCPERQLRSAVPPTRRGGPDTGQHWGETVRDAFQNQEAFHNMMNRNGLSMGPYRRNCRTTVRERRGPRAQVPVSRAGPDRIRANHRIARLLPLCQIQEKSFDKRLTLRGDHDMLRQNICSACTIANNRGLSEQNLPIAGASGI